MIKKFNVFEAPGKTVVFAFGRFNPPTTGHEKLIDKTKQVAGSDEYRIYPSFSQNQNKDPLPHALKVAYMRKMFPRHAKKIIADKSAITAINIAVKLYQQGYTDLRMVAGSDRVKEFETLLRKYNGVEGKRHGFYKFNSIDVVSAGERDPDAEGVAGMSASKMRYHANKGEYDDFADGLPKGFKDGKKLFRDVRKYMGIREQKDMGVMDDYEKLRDSYLTGQIWNIGDLVEARGIEGRVIQRGTNYLTFNDKDGKVHKAWLHEVKQDKDVKDKEGTQPAKYYAGVKSKATKSARDAHFKKGAKMDDDNPAAYEPAPGDASGKTKPSKYTRAYKRMFGEDMPKTLDLELQEKIEGLVKKAEKSGIPYGILKQVYNRGMAAWRTGHRPGTTPQQWAFARVNSFITGGKTRTTADKDLWAKARGRKESYDIGTEYGKHTKDVTPGEKDESLWANIHKKRERIKRGSGEKMRKPGEKGAPTPAQIKRAQLDDWYKDESVQEKYELRYGNEWFVKLTETYEKILSKIDVDIQEEEHVNCGTPDCCGECAEANMTEEKINSFSEFQLRNEWGQIVEAAEYEGKKVKLNDPIRTSENPNKKFKVYVKNEKGNVIVVRFGDPNMEIKRDDPARLKSFRARHNCDNPGPKTKARYWSCIQWRAGAKVDN
tara:strand:- start:2325 stop:4304 length:1980 start_codon:yes stop_codon:yes gene_type:complete